MSHSPAPEIRRSAINQPAQSRAWRRADFPEPLQPIPWTPRCRGFRRYRRNLRPSSISAHPNGIMPPASPSGPSGCFLSARCGNPSPRPSPGREKRGANDPEKGQNPHIQRNTAHVVHHNCHLSVKFEIKELNSLKNHRGASSGTDFALLLIEATPLQNGPNRHR